MLRIGKHIFTVKKQKQLYELLKYMTEHNISAEDLEMLLSTVELRNQTPFYKRWSLEEWNSLIACFITGLIALVLSTVNLVMLILL